VRFFRALLDEHQLDPANCLMIGNDRETDIAGARAVGLDTLYMHTNLTPADQAPANPRKRGRHREFEGSDWKKLVKKLQ
jgi:FMN phosphatase YigB (HAD superfamily)